MTAFKHYNPDRSLIFKRRMSFLLERHVRGSNIHSRIVDKPISNACHSWLGVARGSNMHSRIVDKYKIPHLQYVPATRMLACHLQLNAIHTLGASDPLSSIILYFSKTNNTRADLIFWVCIYGTQEPI